MYRDGVGVSSQLAINPGETARNKGNAPCSAAASLRRTGRVCLMLTAVAASGLVCAPITQAQAAPRHLAAARHISRPGHGAVLKMASRPARGQKPGHHSRAFARNHSAGHAVRTAGVHRTTVPLANTTWDNPHIPPDVMSAIQTAARESGVDPDLLAAIAWRESRFDPSARNRQSSAKGLLQFTTGTWLQAVRDYGSRHDAGNYAAGIHADPSGDLVVAEPRTRAAILRLRDDPILSAKLAAETMNRHGAMLRDQLGRNTTPTDLYLAHVLGPTGAVRFLTAVAKHPSRASTDVANLNILRNAGLLAQDGRPLTVARTYAAATMMLNVQRTHSMPLLAAGRPDVSTAPAAPIQVSEAP